MVNENYTPKMLREILSTDNSGISTLCKEARLIPKKDLSGNTYFTRNDVKTLQKIKDLHTKNKKLVDELMESSSNLKLPDISYGKSIIDETTFEKLNTKFEAFQNSITDKVSEIIDEKLDGMDEVVVELIRCKTENETLRFKMNELEKLNYSLKNQLASFKNIGFNVYLKKEL